MNNYNLHISRPLSQGGLSVEQIQQTFSTDSTPKAFKTELKLRGRRLDDEIIRQRLFELGYRRFDDYPVKLEFNIVEPIKISDINSIISDNIHQWGLQTTTHSVPVITKNNVSTMLKPIEDNFLKDNEYEGFFAFKDFVLKISTSGLHRIYYNNLKQYVWKKKISNRSFDFDTLRDDLIRENPDQANERLRLPDYIPFDEILKQKLFNDENSIFAKFILKLCTNPISGEFEENRFNALATALGHLISQYKNPSYARAIMITELNFNQSAGGGTGKSLLRQALEQVRNVLNVRENTKSDYQFDNYEPDVDIIALDELQKSFSIKRYYDPITGNLTIYKKFVDSKVIPFAKSPKFLFISNYLPIDFDPSTKRRLIVIQLYRHYYYKSETDKREPIEDFGKRFWEKDFHKQNWTLFFLFLAYCLHLYLKNDNKVAGHEFDTIIEQAINTNLDIELLEVFDKIPRDKFVTLKELRGMLIGTSYEGKTKLDSVKKQLEYYANATKIHYEERHSGDRGIVLKTNKK